MEIFFESTLVGRVADKNWPHYLWNVRVGRDKRTFVTISYKMGTGLVNKRGYPIQPTLGETMNSLFSEADAAEYNFADWCSEYGYSDDSISALNIYNACCDTRRQLLSVFSRAEYALLEERFRD